MLCAGLGKSWLDGGKKVGYLKPVTDNQAGVDKDVLFMQQVLGLTEPFESLSPVINLQGNASGVLRSALATLAQNKDLVIMEGCPLNASAGIIEAIDARVLAVHDYSIPLSGAIPEYKKLGARLLGVVINKVPKSKLGRTQCQVSADLNQAGLRFSGMIPEDRTLMALSVADLAESLQGKIANNTENSGDLIENFMMGSSTFDRGAAYYQRKNNKAVLLWGERPGFRKAAMANLQMAALQTSTRCIVISANAAPIPAVLQKAQEKQVPLISAPGTITDLANALEKSMGSLKFTQVQKMPRLLEILKQNLDIQKLSFS
jgi:uncharacterized protein